MQNNNSIDQGPNPSVINIANETLKNDTYRTAIWTGNNMQATVMSINPKDDVGLEIHPDNDQFFRIESGCGMVLAGKSKDNLTFQQCVRDDDAIFIPKGTWHNIVNLGNKPLKFYTIYAPPHHPHGVVHATKEIAEAEGD